MKNSYLLLIYFLWSIGLSACGKDSSTPQPQASFTLEYLEGNYVRFTNTTAQEYASAEWNFGNGTSLTNQVSAEVFYPSKGSYTVTLNIWKSGVQSTATQNVEITRDAIETKLTATPDAQNANYITVACNPALESVRWDFGAKGTSAQKAQKIYYPFAGNYTVAFSTTVNGVDVTENLPIHIAHDDPNYVQDLTLAWSDEFEGITLDTQNWKYETGAGGWGNNEWQNYTTNNTTVNNGTLTITAQKVGAGQKVGDYTSARINSKKYFLYGRLEFRAKLPEYKGKGNWPALWMLGKSIQTGTSWPDCGEIDIMEYVSVTPHNMVSTLHSKANNHTLGTQISTGNVAVENLEGNFHIFGIIWTEKYIKFYLDTPEHILLTAMRPAIYTNDNWPFDKPFYFLMNMAVGGNWGGMNGVDDTIFPAEMEVDYVRVYQHPYENLGQ